MSRSPATSNTVKTYVPASRTLPGISSGPLKVKIVFWFESSAFACGSIAPSTQSPTSNIILAILAIFVPFIFDASFDFHKFASEVACDYEGSTWRANLDFHEYLLNWPKTRTMSVLEIWIIQAECRELGFAPP